MRREAGRLQKAPHAPVGVGDDGRPVSAAAKRLQRLDGARPPAATRGSRAGARPPPRRPSSAVAAGVGEPEAGQQRVEKQRNPLGVRRLGPLEQEGPHRVDGVRLGLPEPVVVEGDAGRAADALAVEVDERAPGVEEDGPDVSSRAEGRARRRFELVGDLVDLAAFGALDEDAQQRLGARVAQEDPSPRAQRVLRRGRRRAAIPSDSSSGTRRATRTLRSVWGIFSSVASSESGRPLSLTIAARTRAVRIPSPAGESGANSVCPEVSPPRAAPVSSISFATLRSPTAARKKRDPLPAEGRLEAVVGHDGADDAAVGQEAAAPPVAGHDPEDVVAVENAAVLVGEDRAVGVAVEGHAEGRAGSRASSPPSRRGAARRSRR